MNIQGLKFNDMIVKNENSFTFKESMFEGMFVNFLNMFFVREDSEDGKVSVWTEEGTTVAFYMDGAYTQSKKVSELLSN